MLSILFCYSAPPNDPCINITHTKPIMSRCLSSSVILPPSNPSCPITPPLPCHPVPMSTAVRRALRFRPSSLSSVPRIAFAAVIATTRQRPPPQWDKLGKPAGIEEGSFVSLFLRRFFGFIYILFSFYTPPPFISFATFVPFFSLFVPRVPAFVWFKWIERQSLSTRPPLPTKKVQTHLKFEPSTARNSSALYLHTPFGSHTRFEFFPPPFIWVYFYYLPTYLLTTLWCICATPLCPIR